MRDDPSGEEIRGEGCAPPPAAEERRIAAKSEAHLEDLIGESLRRYYSKKLSQPLPDKFSQLLRELADKEGK